MSDAPRWRGRDGAQMPTRAQQIAFAGVATVAAAAALLLHRRRRRRRAPPPDAPGLIFTGTGCSSGLPLTGCTLGQEWAPKDCQACRPALRHGRSDPNWRGNVGALRCLRDKDHPHLKLVFSLGGWTKSTYFSGCAKTAAKRAKLVSNAVARMTECFSGAGSTGGGLPKGRSPHATGCSGHAEFGTALLVGDESPWARPCKLALPGNPSRKAVIRWLLECARRDGVPLLRFQLRNTRG